MMQKSSALKSVSSPPLGVASRLPPIGIDTRNEAEIPTACVSEHMLKQYHRWMLLAAGKLPRLSAMRLTDADSAACNAMLVVKAQDDFLYASQEASTIKAYGFDFRGRLLSELKTPSAREFRTLYIRAMITGRPVYCQFVSDVSDRHLYWERLILPLAAVEGGPAVSLLLLQEPVDDKLNVLKTVFERLPMGMIAALPIVSETPGAQDGRVVLINSMAKRMLKLPDSEEKIAYARDLGPWFRQGALWTRVNNVAAGAGGIHYRDQETSKSYIVKIEQLGHFVLFTITEVPTFGPKD